MYLLRYKSRVQDFLSTSVLVFIGKISYGVYLYHIIVSWLWENVLRKAGFHFNKTGLVIQEFILLIFIAWLSWRLIESPINNLKKKFSYSPGISPGFPRSDFNTHKEIHAS
jgi:peptidoglycan/LPS O-acetylase OafA/YrhL